MREARSAYDAAKLLHGSVLVSSQVPEVSSATIESRLHDLNAKLNLPQSGALDEALTHVDAELVRLDQRVRVIESLFARTRELGQQEAELTELNRQADEVARAESELQARRAAAADELAKTQEQLRQLTTQRTLLLDMMATHERRQQSMSDIAALEDRLSEVGSSELRTKEEVQSLRHDLDDARGNLTARSTILAQLHQSQQVTELQRSALANAVSEIAAVPPDHDSEVEGHLGILRQELSVLEQTAEVASRELDGACRAEALASVRLADVSQLGERFLNAASEMRSFSRDSHCPLCGHDHGSENALAQSIERICATALQGADVLRRDLETASRQRQEAEHKQVQIADTVAQTRAEISDLTAMIDDRIDKRRSAFARIESALQRAGIAIPLRTDALRQGQIEAEVKLAGLEQQIRDARAGETEDEARRSEVERAVAAKTSEGQQLERLRAELLDRISRLRAGLVAGFSNVEIDNNKSELNRIEPLVRALQRGEGQMQANVLDLDRSIGKSRAEGSGIERRRQAVKALLDSLDSELRDVGATRDVQTLVEMDQQARQQREALALLKSQASELAQAQRAIEENRALANARKQLLAAEGMVTALQARQKRLERRSSEFETLHRDLEGLQNSTAEIVLSTIRKPVHIIFQAMTAGCPWDIEFRLQDGKVGAVLTDGSARDLAAPSVLNSAYVNVAAIALRLALASQQRWTALRTVVIDDPILEMDNLTQSALIDGLEAVLASTFAPWKDMQFVLTTWSEDFAVMAAHRLAHLNNEQLDVAATTRGEVEEFVIHRLSLDSDGTIVSQQHVPRWRKEAAAA